LANATLTELSANIVSSYLAQNALPPEEIADLIHSTYAALVAVASGASDAAAPPAKLIPAVPIKKSITPEYLISLEDGRKYKSLRRHLRTAYNLSPDEYRARWGLPADYPMVAPDYAASRSALAKTMGLGRGGRQRPAQGVDNAED
jgi:predicted transcriptional regulator